MVYFGFMYYLLLFASFEPFLPALRLYFLCLYTQGHPPSMQRVQHGLPELHYPHRSFTTSEETLEA